MTTTSRQRGILIVASVIAFFNLAVPRTARAGVTVQYCGRVYALSTTVLDPGALNDFVGRFNLTVRDYVDSRGVKDREIPFCGNYTVDSKDRAHPNGKP